MSYIEFKDVLKTYKNGDTNIHALDHANFKVEKGELAIIVGSSGAGKTTALNILGGMDYVSGGHVYIDGVDITTYKKKQLITYRREAIGFVFQFYNLIPNLTAYENVELAAQIRKEAKDASLILRQVGLEERMNNFPSQLSGGEQQRVSIARAIAKNPKLLLCDEPTGALDYETGKQILQLLQNISHEEGMTVVLITHNSAIAPMGDRIIRFKNGQVIDERINEHPIPVSEIEW